MGLVRELLKHLPPGTKIPRKYSALSTEARDVRCLAEHDLFGSTSSLVKNPWIPYAILAGDSVEKVNRLRSGRSSVAMGSEYGLPNQHVLFYNLAPVNTTTLEVGDPVITRILDKITGREYSPLDFPNLKYTGKYARK